MTPLTLHPDRVRRFLTPLLALSLALPAFAQVAAPATPPATPAAVGKDGKTLELSPFVVTSTKDSGYFAENTLMGSRLNSNLADLAASITVVTKQQLEDTGSLDINDVFLYEANTEGAATYTPTYNNRGVLRDGIGGYSADDGTPFGIATANRVRGLGSADTAQNNYPTIQRLAFDSYNTNSVEISRGPNSMLFGTGGASGIVNQSSSAAVLGKQHTQVQLRGGSFDAWRASFNTNIPIGDNLALYIAGLYDSRGFQRKPSSDVYRRQYGALTFQPFRRTKITASYENYDNYNNRPNFASPLDLVSPWIRALKPSWDPTTQMISFSNGTTRGPYLLSTRDARFVSTVSTPTGNGVIDSVVNLNGAIVGTTSLYVPSVTFGSANRQRIRIDGGKIVDYWADATLAGGTATTAPNNVYAAPADAARTQAQQVTAAARYLITRAAQPNLPAASTGATGYNTWYDVAVTDKSIYDWEKYNVQGSNYGTQSAKTSNIELQQQILPNLNFSAGWFRQEMKEWTHYGQGQANDAVRLFVDANTKLLDGSTNPYYGSTYFADWQADSFSHPESNESLRAMLAYELDLTNNKGWTRNLGHHRFLGLVSSQRQWNNNLRYRLSYDGGDPRFLPTATALAATGNGRNSWAGNAAAISRYYYTGSSASPATVTHGIDVFGTPKMGGPDTAQMRFYDWPSQSFKSADMYFDVNEFYAGANFGVTQRKTTSSSFAWQGYLWNERLIPTFGWRRDKVKVEQNNRSAYTNADLYLNGFGVPGFDAVLGVPLSVSGDTKTTGGVIRPFKGWAGLDHQAENGSFLSDVLRNLSVYYNQSDNFNAPTAIQTDYFGTRLPIPSGKGKDYGFGASFFDNKLVVRLNWYKASNENAVSSAAGTVVGRTVRIDTSAGRDWAINVVRIRSGENPADVDFANNTVRPLTSAQQTAVAALWGLPFDWPTGLNIAATESNAAKGKELQLTYNPLRNWTMKLTVGQQQSSYSKAAKELGEWIAYRKPIWQALAAADLPAEYTKANGNKLKVTNFWSGYGFNADANSNTLGATSTPSSTYAGIVEAGLYQLIGLQGTKATNQREWSFSYLTNYNFEQGRFKGFSVGGSVRWADKAVAGYYGLEDPTTYARPNATSALISFPDLARPIYTPAETSADMWLSYSRKILADKVRLKIQLNVRNAFENGGLQATLFNADGTRAQYRIKDPRSWFVTTTFDF